jgi:ketosteroid isomerase-like protein
MPDSTHRDRLASAQQFLTHISRGDFAQATDLLSEDVTYRAEGNNALAGLFTGRDAVTRHLTQLVERTRGTFEAFKWEDWLIGEHHVVGLSSIHARSHGRIYKGRTLTVVGFNVADEIEHLTVFFEDQNAMDRFIGPYA